jgi:hypothetical protein
MLGQLRADAWRQIDGGALLRAEPHMVRDLHPLAAGAAPAAVTRGCRMPKPAYSDGTSRVPPSSSQPCRAAWSSGILAAGLRWRRHHARFAHRVLQ